MEADRIAALLAPFLGGLELMDTQLAQLAAYLDLLLRWNARMNLTAVRDPEQIVTRHFGESLFAARHLYPHDGKPETGEWKLIDVGSGAGFPGLPIKIFAPALQIALLESNQRKATFLREVVRALKLSDVEVLSARAEEYGALGRPLPIGYAVDPRARGQITVTLRAVERFGQVLPTALRLLADYQAANRRLALLIGETQVPTARQLAPAIAWREPLPIPQSSQRVLLQGDLR